jgi:hypothetical protein
VQRNPIFVEKYVKRKSVKIWYYEAFSPYLEPHKSLSHIMALDISARRALAAAIPEPTRTSTSSSPTHGLIDNSESAALYMKAVSEGAQRLLSQQTSRVLSSSPSSSLLDSPQQSPLQDSASHHSLSPQPQPLSNQFMAPNLSLPGAFQLQSAVRSLKFSIENILSPEFGKNEKECRKTILTNGEKHKLKSHPHRNNSRTHPLDVSSLTNKRKHSSDSESSNISSLSTTSRDTLHNNHSNNSNKESQNGRKDTSSPNTLDNGGKPPLVWPAWVYCTRYSDRPSSGESLSFTSFPITSRI